MRHSITMDVFYSLAILYSVAEERQKIITWQIPWKNLILPEWYQVGIEWNTTSNSCAILAPTNCSSNAFIFGSRTRLRLSLDRLLNCSSNAFILGKLFTCVKMFEKLLPLISRLPFVSSVSLQSPIGDFFFTRVKNIEVRSLSWDCCIGLGWCVSFPILVSNHVYDKLL